MATDLKVTSQKGLDMPPVGRPRLPSSLWWLGWDANIECVRIKYEWPLPQLAGSLRWGRAEVGVGCGGAELGSGWAAVGQS